MQLIHTFAIEIEMKDNFSHLKDMLVPSTVRTSKYVEMLIEKRLTQENLDLTMKQFILLMKVSEKDCSQAELALITGRDKGSLTRLIQSLERKKFITRNNSIEDKRVNIVKTSVSGLEILEEAKKIVFNTFNELTEKLTKKEEELFIKTIHKIQAQTIHLLDEPSKKHNEE